jgi:hypothetical protein
MKTVLTLLAVVLTTTPAFAQTQPGTQQPQRESEAGGQATQFSLTPQQFNQYANGPLSLFDHTAEQGIEKNFSLLTGQPGTTGQAGTMAGAQYAQAAVPNTGGIVSDARPNAPPATGYTAAQNAALRAKGQEILDAQTKAAPNDQPSPLVPRPAATPPAATPPSATSFDTRLARVPGAPATPTARASDWSRVPLPRTGYNAGTVPGPARPGFSPLSRAEIERQQIAQAEQYRMNRDPEEYPGGVRGGNTIIDRNTGEILTMNRGARIWDETSGRSIGKGTMGGTPWTNMAVTPRSRRQKGRGRGNTGWATTIILTRWPVASRPHTMSPSGHNPHRLRRHRSQL